MVGSLDDVEDWRELPMREVLRRLGKRADNECSENDVSNAKQLPESNDRLSEQESPNKPEIDGGSKGEEANEDLEDPSIEKSIPEVMHEMYDFMKRFKAFRNEAGLTRNDTVLALNRRYGLRLSKDALSSFEQYLDPAGVRKWFRYLSEWMSDAQAILATGMPIDVILKLPPKEPNVVGLSEANKRYTEAKARRQKKRARRQDRGNLIQPTDGNTESLEMDELLELFGEKPAEKCNNKAKNKGRRKPKQAPPSKKVEIIASHVEEIEDDTVVDEGNIGNDSARKTDAYVQNATTNAMEIANETAPKMTAESNHDSCQSLGWKVRMTDGKTLDVMNRKPDESLIPVNVSRLFAHLWDDFQRFGAAPVKHEDLMLKCNATDQDQ